jgi:hypothetical protein
MAGSAFATQTRVLTLGEVGEVMKDDDNVQTYPQTMKMYPNLGIAEISGGSFSTSGWHMAHGDFVMGGYWTTGEMNNGYIPFDYDGDGNNGLDQKFSLLYARDLGGMPFGFTFELWGNNDEHKETNDKSLNTGLGMRFGVGLTLMENLEAALKFGMLSWEQKDNNGNAVAEGEGGTSIVLNARYWMPENEWGTMVPHFMFHMESAGSKPASGSATTDDMTAFELGIGGTMPAGDKITVVHDLGVHFHSATMDNGSTKTEKGMNLLPYFKGGMEAPLGEHFTFRCGGVKEWNSNSSKTGSDEHLWSGASTRLYIGAGYKRGNFGLDGWMDPGFFTRGPYLISGAAGSLFSQVTLHYAW